MKHENKAVLAAAKKLIENKQTFTLLTPHGGIKKFDPDNAIVYKNSYARWLIAFDENVFNDTAELFVNVSDADIVKYYTEKYQFADM